MRGRRAFSEAKAGCGDLRPLPADVDGRSHSGGRLKGQVLAVADKVDTISRDVWVGDGADGFEGSVCIA